MGKATGFLEFVRTENEAVSPLDRIKNYNEFHIPLSEDKRREHSGDISRKGQQRSGSFADASDLHGVADAERGEHREHGKKARCGFAPESTLDVRHGLTGGTLTV